MNVLIYNYLQAGESGSGGVGVYIANLAEGLAAARHRVITMSSGDIYALTNRKPWLRVRRDRYDRAVIVNSPQIATAGDAFDDLRPYTQSDGLDAIPAALRERFGAIDVFHFQNLEGLTRSFFERVRAEFPDAKLILSIHNYNVVCPQVDLWHQDRVVCTNYRHGRGRGSESALFGLHKARGNGRPVRVGF